MLSITTSHSVTDGKNENIVQVYERCRVIEVVNGLCEEPKRRHEPDANVFSRQPSLALSSFFGMTSLQVVVSLNGQMDRKTVKGKNGTGI